MSNSIDRLPKGYVFTYTDFMDQLNHKEAIIKALNRMTTTGKIVKLSKGKFYKAEKTPFGIVDCIHQNMGNGYIWHTTGSGGF